MLKHVLATTALVACASAAAAEVRLSGYGRFGLDYIEANDGRAIDSNGNGIIDAGDTVLSDTSLTSRLRLQIDMNTETDSGVAFGARFRAQAESRDGTANGATFNGARFYATYGGFTLGVGNIMGALDEAPGLYLETRSTGVGVDGSGFTSLVTNVGNSYDNWDQYSSSGAGRNGIEVMYSAGPLAAHLSYSSDNDQVGTIPATVVEGAQRTAAYVSYTFGDWTAALGMQDSNVAGEDKTFAAVSGDFGVWGARVAFADNDGIKKYGVYGTVDVAAATTLVAFVTDEDNPGTIFDGTGYGLNVSHDMGGGTSLEAGWVQSSTDNTTVQAGVYFSF